MNEEEKLIDRMINKSIEAFLLGIEIYNKPTIKYRAESFAFHICNAWELVLKAYLIKRDGLNKIYFANKTSQGTISLKTALSRVFTNKLDPIYKNLEEVINLRNTSTHYIIEEHNSTYVHIFQSCAYNYYNFLSKKIKLDLSDKIEFDFILLITPNKNKDFYKLNGVDERIVDTFKELNKTLKENVIEINSENYSINVNYVFSSSNSKINIDPNSKNIVSVQNINKVYPYRQSEAYRKINTKLKSLGISKNFRQHELNEFNKYFNLKENTNYYTVVNQGTKTPLWLCNENLIKFIVEEYKKNPEVLEEIKKKRQ